MECVLDAQAELGEGPVWDPDAGCLYFVDIERGLVHRYDPDTQASRSHQVDAMVGAVALTVSGDLLLAVRDGFARLDPDSGRVRRDRVRRSRSSRPAHERRRMRSSGPLLGRDDGDR